MRPNYFQKEWLVPVQEEPIFAGLKACFSLEAEPQYTKLKVDRYIRREFWTEEKEYSLFPLSGREKEIALIGYLRGRGFNVYDAKFIKYSYELEAETFLVFVHEKDKLKSEGRMEKLHK